jgi:hypothetical protein
LTFEPFRIVKRFAQQHAVLFLPPALIHGAIQGVNASDRRLAAAAIENECILVTDDHELVVEARECGIDARTVFQAGVGRNLGQSRVDGPRRLWAGRHRAKAAGHYFFRGQTRGVRGQDPIALFDAAGRVCIRFDPRHSRWSATLDHLERVIEVPFDQQDSTSTLIVLSYSIDSRPGRTDQFQLMVGTDLQNQNRQSLNVRGIQWLRHQRGQLHIGGTRDGRHHFNGLIAQFGYGPGQVGKGTWRAMLRDPSILPSLGDADTLDAALLAINSRAAFERGLLPRLSELF